MCVSSQRINVYRKLAFWRTQNSEPGKDVLNFTLRSYHKSSSHIGLCTYFRSDHLKIGSYACAGILWDFSGCSWIILTFLKSHAYFSANSDQNSLHTGDDVVHRNISFTSSNPACTRNLCKKIKELKKREDIRSECRERCQLLNTWSILMSNNTINCVPLIFSGKKNFSFIVLELTIFFSILISCHAFIVCPGPFVLLF